MKFTKRVLALICFLFLFFIFLRFLFRPVEKIGEVVPAQSRDHIGEGESHPSYNSNPPTSGWHYGEPVKAGVYSEEWPDENLIHSLEHGYVIISYNCNVNGQSRLIGTVLAHEGEASATISSESSSSALVEDEGCHRMVDDLTSIIKDFKTWKLILTPREKLETRLALTAWGRIDKFNPSSPTGSGLSEADRKRIEKFINTYRDRAPEKTPD